MPDYHNEYNEESFWDKLKKFASSAGCNVILKVLTLYYALIDSDTPVWAKTIIIGSLGYFIFPIDAIPDILPFIGYSDDLLVLVSAIAAVELHIKPQHKEEAKQKVKDWFPSGCD